MYYTQPGRLYLAILSKLHNPLNPDYEAEVEKDSNLAELIYEEINDGKFCLKEVDIHLHKETRESESD